MYRQPVSFNSRTTNAVKILLWVIGGVFILQLSLWQFARIPLEGFLGFRPSSVWLDGEVWQLLTYPFLHGGLLHIVFNCLMLWMLGSMLESRWGAKKFFLYFLCCSIGGAFFQTVIWILSIFAFPSYTSFLGNLRIIGASGGVFGLFMAFGLLYKNAQVLAFLIFPMKAKHFVTMLALIEIVSAVFYSDPGSGGGIAHLVHLGGLITGFLCLRYLGPNLNGPPSGGFFRKKRKMSREEVRQRLSVISNEEPKYGDQGQPITWN